MEGLKGKQLGGYQIVAQLGAGGMATVYKAYQPRMDRYVALKILPRHLSDNIEFVERFSQEARVIAKLEHPHILPVHDFGEDAGYTYLAMRLVQGGSLAQLLRKHRRFALAKINRIIRQVGEALDYAHKQGVIHRDFKPGNVLIDEFENCLLTDFGIAKLMETSSNLTATGGILGTPTYVSPEQGMGKAIDHRSDIYSLGVVLYQMVTGDVPYKADTPMGVIFKHVQDPLPLPRDKVPDLPESVERVILRALAKNPDDRFESAVDLVRAFERAMVAPEVGVPAVTQTGPDAEKPETTSDAAEGNAGAPDGVASEATPSHLETVIRTKTLPLRKPKAHSVGYGVLAAIVIFVLSIGGWSYYKKISGTVPIQQLPPILSVNSKPAGANVYVDEAHVGLSPVSVKKLVPGTHKIRISLDRYQDYHESLLIQEDEPRKITADLVPEPFGDLKLTSIPPGADIFIDGQKMGLTPADLKNIAEGTRNVLLQKEGFDPWEEIVHIVPLQTAKVSADLNAIYGGVDIASNPSGAEVWIDGQLMGKSPLVMDKVGKGQRKIQVKLEGFDDWSQSVVIRSKEMVKINATMKTIYGALHVASSPSDADVYIDGKRVGQTPLAIDRVEKGIRKIEIIKAGFDPWTGTTEIVAKKTVSVEADLSEKFGSLKVISEPDGADVHIDGREEGKTPLLMAKIEKGSLRVEAKKTCFRTANKTVAIKAGKQTLVRFDLDTVCGNISVESSPPGAEWFLDGRRRGTTPGTIQNIAKGDHQIKLIKKGHDDWNSTVTVKAGQTEKITADLVLAKVRENPYIQYPSGVVKDKKTDLEWFAGPDINTNWNDGKQWVESLTVDGGGWRMPTLKELEGLYQKEAGIRNMTPLLKTSGWWVWSGETKGSVFAWIFHFYDGKELCHHRSFSADSVRAFAVRSTSKQTTRLKPQILSDKPYQKKNKILKDESYIKYPSGIVEDIKTGLEWFAGPDEDTNWNEAKSWIKNLSVDGGGWRMPTIQELKTLFQKGAGERNVTPLLDTTGWWVWSGERKGPEAAWYFYFGIGKEDWISRIKSKNGRGYAVRTKIE